MLGFAVGAPPPPPRDRRRSTPEGRRCRAETAAETEKLIYMSINVFHHRRSGTKRILK